jgi:hypothetical protein
VHGAKLARVIDALDLRQARAARAEAGAGQRDGAIRHGGPF